MASEHVKKSHNVSCLLYHLVCPAKYRRLVFEQIDGVNQVIININTVGKSANEEAIQDYTKHQGAKYEQLYRKQPKLFEGY